LERRAGSSSASPEQSHSELAVSSTKESSQRQGHGVSRQTPKSSVSHPPPAPPLSPELLPLDDHSALFESPATRPLSGSSPPAFTYSTYPPTTSYLQHEYEPQTVYHSTPSYYSDYQYQTDYSQQSSLPPTLPTMLPSSYAKQEHLFGEDDLLSPFSMNYASLAGLDVPSSHTYSGANSHVNPTAFFSRSYSSPAF